jgi:hypothetical protein
MVVEAARREDKGPESGRCCFEPSGHSRHEFQQEAKVHEALLRHLFRL